MTIALTMGDPAGIGAEIVAKLMFDISLDLDRPPAPVLVYGDAPLLSRTVDQLRIPLRVETVTGVSDFVPARGRIAVVQGPVLPASLRMGEVSSEAGHAAYSYVCSAVADAMGGAVDAVVTAPLHKEAMRLAGHDYPGHTELLAHLSGTDDVSMLMASADLNVVLVTIHLSLREAIDAVTEAAVHRAIIHASRVHTRSAAPPRIAVAGLNPHAGENGLMGREELDIITPAIAAARALGVDVHGPFPPDTIFMRAKAGEFDVVVAQYHDQGLIPFKYLGLDTGTNVTLGLPFIRTSVDHGTAFDLVGQGIAAHASLRVALDQAIALTAVV